MVQATQPSPVKPYRRTLKQLLSVKLMPNFIIIGAQKSGTGSLYDYLTGHPDVIRARMKEVTYFDANFHRGLGWYRGQFPLLADQYYRRRGNALVTGEASPNYIIHPLAPERIQRVVPDAKLIVLLRNPVERAYSHYQHNLRDKSETLSFEDALKAEPERLAGLQERLMADSCTAGYNARRGVTPADQFEFSKPSGDWLKYCKSSYHRRGVYVDQLKAWTSVFPRDQMLILPFEQLCMDPRTVFLKTLDFLGLTPWEPGSYGKSNYFGRYGDVKPDTRRALEAYYASYNEQLYEFLGTRYDW